MKIDLYLHGSKEASYDAGERAGLTEKALEKFIYAGYEHKITYEVDETGRACAIEFDGRKINEYI